MIVLGIETSCDETSCAVVENGIKILSNVVVSQEKLHSKYYGVVPELASRAHVENINWVMEEAVRRACPFVSRVNSGLCDWRIVDAVAFTEGPGLMGSLLVGQIAAQTSSYVLNVPIIGVNHLEGHILSVCLEHPKLKPPFLALIVSGGHTELVIVKRIGIYKILGQTRDDAAGESFDKVAKLLSASVPSISAPSASIKNINFCYPGGPVIEKFAKMGNPGRIKFPRPYMWGTWDFSFSGLKTAVVYYVRDNIPAEGCGVSDVYDICAGFQQAVVDTLIKKTVAAAKKFNLNRVAVCGGVSANSFLQQEFYRSAGERCLKVFFPRRELCTDNAAMIASAGYYKLKNSKKTFRNSVYNVRVDPNLSLRSWC